MAELHCASDWLRINLSKERERKLEKLNYKDKDFFELPVSKKADAESICECSVQSYLDRKRQDFPKDEVLTAFRISGKHFIPDSILRKLSEVRTNCAPQDQFLQKWLDCLLDKHDEKYDYTSYLCLSLLGLPNYQATDVNIDFAEQKVARFTRVVLADILRFEYLSINDMSYMPEHKTDMALLSKRVLCTNQILKSFSTSESIRTEYNRNPVSYLVSFVNETFENLSPQEKQILKFSNLTVHTTHDEYMFIRILQCFEHAFSWIASLLTQAVYRLEDNTCDSLNMIRRAEKLLKSISGVFRLIATMRPESFMQFRTFTEGASAIQSRSYKWIEAICKIPSGERLNSPAFDSVPELKQKILDLETSFATNFTRLRQHENLPVNKLKDTAATLESFGNTFNKWRQVHFSLAHKILSDDSPGTGYTLGVPYLRSTKEIPLFDEIIDSLNSQISKRVDSSDTDTVLE